MTVKSKSNARKQAEARALAISARASERMARESAAIEAAKDAEFARVHRPVTLRTRQANNVLVGDFIANLGLVNGISGAGILRLHGINGSYIEVAWNDRVVLAS